ncbi:cubilin-like [Ruditapes philippinarum]|uniref:cubilin-like n=1 Tax=Ruditapes philippinarum TaxID=129788 RepID=UPI00295B4852|nr:cubilin-like [Ruditapes philippinarum]
MSWLTVKYAIVLILTLYHVIDKGECQCSSTNKNAVETILVNETISTFTTPGYRVAYYPRMSCVWIFDAGTSAATIVFDIQEILIENSRRCSFDSITFYEGNTTSGTELAKKCGRLTSSSVGSFVSSSGQYATVLMKSDSSRQYAGVKMNVFYAIEKSAGSCSGNTASITATTTSDYITSPGYPASLDNGVDCSWTITCAPGTVLYIEIEYSDLEYTSPCFEQILAIYDGTSNSDPAVLESWCDSKANFPTQSTVYFTTGNTAFITLKTEMESAAERHGFRINFRQNSSAITTTTAPITTTTQLVQVCSSSPTELDASDNAQYFRSLNYPNDYPNNVNCYWRITAPIGFTINLTFVDSNIQPGEDCSISDSVTVYDGRSSSYPRMTRFCGAESPVLASTGRYLYVHLKTDLTVGYRGFSAMYQTVPSAVPDCVVTGITENITASDTPQSLTSPGYPNNYNDSTVTYWMITNPNETQALAITVTDSRLEASVDCIYDRVQIYQGPCTSYPLLGTFCGEDTPTYYYDTGAYALVVLTTDGNVNYKGFNISVYLTDKPDDDLSALVVTGIIVGCVLGGSAVIAGVSFGVYKYVNRGSDHVPSRDSSRRSSASSSSDGGITNRSYMKSKVPRRLPPIKEFYTSSFTKR